MQVVYFLNPLHHYFWVNHFIVPGLFAVVYLVLTLFIFYLFNSEVRGSDVFVALHMSVIYFVQALIYGNIVMTDFYIFVLFDRS